MLQNTNTDGTEDNPEGGDAPEAGGPESLTTRDGPGAEGTESLNPQEDSGPSGPTSVTSYGPPKTAGAGRIESVSSTCYDGGDNVLYNKSPKSSKSARKSAESKMLAAGQIPVSETTPPTKLSTRKCVVQIIAAVFCLSSTFFCKNFKSFQ